MTYGQEIPILGLSWARLHFVENNGMAFGISLGGSWGKLALSLFRIIAVSVLIYWIRMLIKAKAPFGFVCSIALILAGAIGNIVDSVFYGVIFSDSYHGQLAEFLPEAGGYSKLLFGRVVDMLYFPLFEGYFPDWFPIWGGEPFLFFRPVFNLADTAITTGVLSIIFFHRSAFSNIEDTLAESKKAAAENEDKLEEVSTTTNEEANLQQNENDTLESTSTEEGASSTEEDISPPPQNPQ